MNLEPNSSNLSILPTFTPDQQDTSEDTSCRPYFYDAPYPGYYCDYVKNQTELCSGGGYLIWTEYVVCQEDAGLKALIIIGSIVFLFLMFFLMAITADDFLSTNIEMIVEKLKISQNIAGVTFMAFANGAPDVFTAIASVVGADRPQADLALASLMGGAIFIGTVVFAMIVLVKPFKIMRRPIIRDIIFFLLGMVWLAVIMFHDNQVYIWGPAVFLGLYLIYTLTVIFGRICFVKKVGARQLSWVSSNMSQKSGSFVFKFKNMISKNKKSTESKTTMPTTATMPGDNSTIQNEPNNKVVIMVSTPNLDRDESHEKVIKEHGKFFVPEDTEDEMTVSNMESEEEKANLEKQEDKKRCCTWGDCLRWIKKFFKAIKQPAVEILSLTVPLADQPWNRPLTILHCFTAPLLFMFAFQCFGYTVENGPPIWLLIMCGSLVVATLLVCITDAKNEPRFYRIIAAFVGFVLAAIWIYELANEMVNVVMMIGVILNISNEILGITIISWANCIGDMIADTAVARKGFPRMGISAVIGGPLYNVFFGFGISFIVAKAQNKYVSLNVNTPLKIMLIANSAGLIVNLILILVQRFNLKRFHGFILVGLYIAFLVVSILAELKIIVF